MVKEGNSYEITTTTEDFDKVHEALKAKKLPIESAEIAKVPSTYIKLEGRQAEQMLKLYDKLEELDDIQNVWANFDIADEEHREIQQGMMLILGLDPGSLSFGIGIVKREKGRFAYVHSETIRLKEKDFLARMQDLWDRLERTGRRLSPWTRRPWKRGFSARTSAPCPCSPWCAAWPWPPC